MLELGIIISNLYYILMITTVAQRKAAQIQEWNVALRSKSPLEIVAWASAEAGGRAVVSTNFGPYEAVLLHLCVQVQPDIPVLWVDHGYNRVATYGHAEQLRERLGLNLKCFVPKLTPARREVLYGPVPGPDGECRLKEFSSIMKLEPFRRGMAELAPTIWLTALRKVQNPNRAGLDIISEDRNFNTLKVSPVFHWTDADMEAYLAEHDLPNEPDYFDPAKADEKRECGLHVTWGGKALAAS